MIETVAESAAPAYSWIDVAQPTREELQELARKHGFHQSSVEDCLEPEHLPKFERIGATTFLIVRSWDDASRPGADTTRQLTRKLAIFVSDRAVLTVHRSAQSYLDEAKARLSEDVRAGRMTPHRLAIALVDAAIDTFWKPLDAAEEDVALFDRDVFAANDVPELIQDVYAVKRRVTVIRWMARHTLDVVLKLKPASEPDAPAVQDLKEHVDGLFFAADELLEDANNLLNVQLALAAHETNRVIRVLTLFSVFFMPLTFIVGIYGMNFEHMPELKWPLGYGFSWLLMTVTVLAIALWFWRQGWLFRPRRRRHVHPEKRR